MAADWKKMCTRKHKAKDAQSGQQQTLGSAKEKWFLTDGPVISSQDHWWPVGHNG